MMYNTGLFLHDFCFHKISKLLIYLTKILSTVVFFFIYLNLIILNIKIILTINYEFKYITRTMFLSQVMDISILAMHFFTKNNYYYSVN